MLTKIERKQRSTTTITFRLGRGDKRKIDLLKAHYRQSSVSAAIKLAISDAVDRINRSADTMKLSEKAMDSYIEHMNDQQATNPSKDT